MSRSHLNIRSASVCLPWSKSHKNPRWAKTLVVRSWSLRDRKKLVRIRPTQIRSVSEKHQNHYTVNQALKCQNLFSTQHVASTPNKAAIKGLLHRFLPLSPSTVVHVNNYYPISIANDGNPRPDATVGVNIGIPGCHAAASMQTRTLIPSTDTSSQQGLHTLLVVENSAAENPWCLLLSSPKVCLFESWSQHCILCVAWTCECTLHIHCIYRFYGVLYFLPVSRRQNKLMDCLTEGYDAGDINEKPDKTTGSKIRGFIFW